MDNFISISEAAKLTGKTEKTIRRLIKSLAENVGGHWVDSKDYPIQREQKGKMFIYLIKKNYLLERFGIEKGGQWEDKVLDNVTKTESSRVDNENHTEQDSDSTETKGNVYPQDNLISSLQDHILTLKNQLQEKDQHIKELTERTREANVMLNNLQNKLFLLEQPKAEEPRNDQTEHARKQSLLSRLFGKKQS